MARNDTRRSDDIDSTKPQVENSAALFGRGTVPGYHAIALAPYLSRASAVGLIVVLALGVGLGFGLRSVIAGAALTVPWQDSSPKFRPIALGRLAACQHWKEDSDQEGNCRVGGIFRNDGGQGTAIATFTASSRRANGTASDVQCSAVIPRVAKGDAAEAACVIFAKPGEDLEAPIAVHVIGPAQAASSGARKEEGPPGQRPERS